MTIEEIQKGIDFIKTEDKEATGYAILINGNRFQTAKGKCIWKLKNHASTAFRLDVEPKLQRMVKYRLMTEPGYSGNYFRNREYRDCFQDFKQYLIDNNILKIVELSESHG